MLLVVVMVVGELKVVIGVGATVVQGAKIVKFNI